MPSYRALQGVDRFTRSLFTNIEARRRVLAILNGGGSVPARVERLRAEVRQMRGTVALPRLTNADARELVQGFDEVRARNPATIAALGDPEIPSAPPPFDDMFKVS